MAAVLRGRLAAAAVVKRAMSSGPVYVAKKPAWRPLPDEHVPAWVKDFKTGEKLEFVQLRKIIWGLPIRRDILQRVVVWQLARRRQGTQKTKGRSEVRGSTKKMGPQKGSGGARHGTKRAPIFVKGGVAHGPRPRSYAFKLNKKVRSLGVRVALSSKYYQADGLHIVDDESLEVEKPKTRPMLDILRQNGWADKKTLIVTTDKPPVFFERSLRILPYIQFVSVKGLNVYDIIRAHRVIITKGALQTVETRFRDTFEPKVYAMPTRPLDPVSPHLQTAIEVLQAAKVGDSALAAAKAATLPQ